MLRPVVARSGRRWSASASLRRRGAMTYQDINVKPIETGSSFRMKAYKALKAAIMEMDIYSREEIRLEERRLSGKLGVSRTPIREAMTLLEQEGFVRSVPRRGIFVVHQVEARDHRDDHGMGSPRRHGGAPRLRAGERGESVSCARTCMPSPTAIPRSSFRNIRRPTSPSTS